MEWKWTKGEPYERSRRIFKEQSDKDIEKFNKEIETSAYSTALNHDENTWDILNQTHQKLLHILAELFNAETLFHLKLYLNVMFVFLLKEC